MKKTLAFILSLMMLAVFAVGCSTADDEVAAVTPTAETEAAMDADDNALTDGTAADETVETETSVEPEATEEVIDETTEG